MKKSLVICLSLLLTVNSYSQQLPDASQRVFKSVENMQSVINLNKISQTGITFDTRYEGVKGSPRLTDTLLQSFLKLAGQDYYYEIKADPDLVNNALIYAGSGSGQMFSIPSSDISELVYTADRRYDEYVNETKYYLKGRDGIYKQVQLNKKSIIKAIPEKKEIIEQAFSKGSSDDKESLVMSILGQN